MNKKQLSKLKKIHNGSSNHRKKLEKNKLCGCFYCKREFQINKITEWIDSKTTALCPHCGIDSVIPLDKNKDNSVMLKEMSDYWFSWG